MYPFPIITAFSECLTELSERFILLCLQLLSSKFNLPAHGLTDIGAISWFVVMECWLDVVELLTMLTVPMIASMESSVATIAKNLLQ